jgi:hypothetical protein
MLLLPWLVKAVFLFLLGIAISLVGSSKLEDVTTSKSARIFVLFFVPPVGKFVFGVVDNLVIILLFGSLRQVLHNCCVPTCGPGTT